jgi:SNW domain-containing protein 1
MGARAGAFPEVQVAQYPLDMGRPGAKPGGVGGAGSKTLAVTVGADGGVNYDAIVKQGGNKNKWIASTHGAMVPKLDQLKDVRPLPPICL